MSGSAVRVRIYFAIIFIGLIALLVMELVKAWK